MYKFGIWEVGQRFAIVEARDAEHALDIAEAEYPRRACDYNMSDGDAPFEVEWAAHAAEDAAANARSAIRKVKVPS